MTRPCLVEACSCIPVYKFCRSSRLVRFPHYCELCGRKLKWPLLHCHFGKYMGHLESGKNTIWYVTLVTVRRQGSQCTTNDQGHIYICNIDYKLWIWPPCNITNLRVWYYGSSLCDCLVTVFWLLVIWYSRSEKIDENWYSVSLNISGPGYFLWKWSFLKMFTYTYNEVCMFICSFQKSKGKIVFVQFLVSVLVFSECFKHW